MTGVKNVKYLPLCPGGTRTRVVPVAAASVEVVLEHGSSSPPTSARKNSTRSDLSEDNRESRVF